MIAVGIDVGLKNTYVVLMKDGEVISKNTAPSGGASRVKTIDSLWQNVLADAGISASDVSSIAATGQGKQDVSFAGAFITEPVADARAAKYYYPDATSIVDVGADQTRIVTLGAGKNIEEVVLNQKCMAGLGLLLDTIGKRLDMSIDEIGKLPSDAGKGRVVNDGCPVFAELDALELLNENVPKVDIAGAVIETVAVRLNSILNDKIVPKKDGTVLIGGVSKNTAVVERLQSRSGIDFIIPDNAEYGSAIGAALIAADSTAM